MEDNKNKKDLSELEKEFDVENSTIFVKNEQNGEKEHKKKAKSDNTEGGVAHKANSLAKMIAIIVAAAVVLTGSMFALKFAWPVEDENTQQTEQEDTSVNLTAQANVALKDMKNVDKNAISNISKISVQNTDKFEIVPDKKIESTDDDGNKSESVQYKMVGYEDIPQDYTKISNFAESMLDVTAENKLEGNWSDKDCGLDKPAAVVTVTMADKSGFDLKVGAKVPDGKNNYYVKCSLKKDDIYIISSDFYDSVTSNVLSYVDTQMIQALEASGDDDSYFNESKLVKYDEIQIGGTHISNPITLTYQNSSVESLTFRITEPVSTYASDSSISTLLTPLSSGMTASNTAMIRPSAADLKKAGLDKPYFTVKYTVKGKTYSLKFSKQNAMTDGYYCCMVDDVPVVYEIMNSMYTFVEWTLTNIRSSILYSRNIETIDTMTYTVDGKSTEYTIKYDKVKDEETTTAEQSDNSSQTTTAASENYQVSVYSNSAELDAPSFQTLYSHLILVSPTDYLKVGEKIPTGEPVLTVTCKNHDGTTDVMKFVKYNSRYYSYTINGIGDSLVRYDTVDNLIDEIHRYQKGEKITD